MEIQIVVPEKYKNEKDTNCPDGICDVSPPPYDKRKLLIIIAFLALFVLTYFSLKAYKISEKPQVIIIKGK